MTSPVFVGVIPTQIYTAASVGTPTMSVFNAGNSTVYLGQAGVTAADGFPLPPNAKISYAFAPWNIYAIAAQTTTTTTTTLSAAASAGATSVTVTSATGLAAGNVITIGTGEEAEDVKISSIASTTLTLATALEFTHASGDTVTLDTLVGGGPVIVTAGVH